MRATSTVSRMTNGKLHKNSAIFYQLIPYWCVEYFGRMVEPLRPCPSHPGSEVGKSDELRLHQGGLLRTSNGGIYPPLDEATFNVEGYHYCSTQNWLAMLSTPNAKSGIPWQVLNIIYGFSWVCSVACFHYDKHRAIIGGPFYLAGDDRANEQLGLLGNQLYSTLLYDQQEFCRPQGSFSGICATFTIIFPPNYLQKACTFSGFESTIVWPLDYWKPKGWFPNNARESATSKSSCKLANLWMLVGNLLWCLACFRSSSVSITGVAEWKRISNS